MSTLDSERWRAASAELDRALELQGDERATHLAALRRRDPALADDVERLLEEHRALDAEGFLQQAPALGPAADDATRTAGLADSAPSAVLAGGTRFGAYRIVRPLGRGGMGAVYEADELDSGRRVALKVLEERLTDDRERERFHREGRLAASLNHPHCVFVFAAAEVDGRLAIAMELMQGTLADRLKAGPLSPADAVDVVLQLLSGLQAAAALGILHRDIKPSNCFVSAAGVVKIGDFGISRSLRPTEETALSTRTKFAATPAYASPEQLRGAALDVRSDVYSLGATLYELLTGQRPFERPDLMALLMAVANDPPQPPHVLVPSVPRGLSQVVLRCLSKQPDQRFTDYGALEAALAPYSSKAATPATFGRRCLAGVTDHLLLTPFAMALSFWLIGSFMSFETSKMWHQGVASYLVMLLYFGISESVWARSPGKALLGLTLIDTNGRPPGARQAVGRAATYVSFWSIAPLLSLLWVPADPAVRIRESSGHLSLVLSSVFPLLLPATVFCTARRRNGYAGLHDLASRTRIVEYRVHARSAGRATPPPPPTAMHVAVGKLGPFSILGQGTARMPAGWLPGFDARLRRSVWIREAPPGAPPLDSARLAVDRATRLRWLAGRRGPDAAWDVFEAVPGVPLEDACARPRTWADVRWWLLDLACECAAHSPEDAPPLRADRVWILESGGAKLLDDPAVDRTRRTDAAQEASCAALLLDVVRAARGPDAPPWPLAAQRFVHELSGDPPPDNTAIARALEPLTRRRAVLTRGWRALSIAALSALPVFVSGFATLMAGLGTSQVRQMPLDVRVTVEALGRLARADSDRSALSPQDRQAIEVALATRYRPTLTHLTQFPLEYWPWVLLPHHRQIAERLLLRHPTDPDSQQVTRHLAVQALIRDASKPPDLPPVSIIGVAMLVVSYGTAALISLVTALAFRGGITRILGLEFVTADGKPASRLRVLGRTALAWLPLLLPLGAVVVANAVRMPVSRFTMSMWASGVCVLLALAVVIVSILHPERGIQDRLAGTWIVPR